MRAEQQELIDRQARNIVTEYCVAKGQLVGFVDTTWLEQRIARLIRNEREECTMEPPTVDLVAKLDHECHTAREQVRALRAALQTAVFDMETEDIFGDNPRITEADNRANKLLRATEPKLERLPCNRCDGSGRILVYHCEGVCECGGCPEAEDCPECCAAEPVA